MAEKPRIAVYTSSSPSIDKKYIDFAFEVGRGIAISGWDLVWGGGRTSMMGAVASGAKSHGSRTIGVIPEKLISIEFADSDASELHVVKDMRARKGMIEELSQAFIVLPGGIGTLEEFFEIWVGRYLGFHEKPVVVCDPFGTYTTLRTALEDLTQQRFMKAGQELIVDWCSDITSALVACRQGMSEFPNLGI